MIVTLGFFDSEEWQQKLINIALCDGSLSFSGGDRPPWHLPREMGHNNSLVVYLTSGV
ncbi:hypothetical protein SYNPCC7002_A0321 [Picosynechococcus sp. PCC 7002]|nr:hypothetical protein SYNPCC7002_A0321 [Picosynechococcus sp. PCC 7002]